MIPLVYIFNFQYDRVHKERCQMYKVICIQQFRSFELSHEALTCMHSNITIGLLTLTVGGVIILFLTKNTVPHVLSVKEIRVKGRQSKSRIGTL